MHVYYIYMFMYKYIFTGFCLFSHVNTAARTLFLQVQLNGPVEYGDSISAAG